jgi:GT2 family glycosyltransferase
LDEKCLAELFASLESDDSIASVAPKLLRWDFANLSKTDVIDSCGIIMALGLRFFDLGQGEKDSRIFDSAKIIGPSGAFAAYRISALSDIKLGRDYFDSRMFMYKEDCDLDYRLFLAGHRSQFVPKAIAYHDRSVSSVGGRKSRSLAVRRWSWQNQKLIWNKYWRKQSLAGKILVALYFISQYCWLAVFERNVLKNK